MQSSEAGLLRSCESSLMLFAKLQHRLYLEEFLRLALIEQYLPTQQSQRCCCCVLLQGKWGLACEDGAIRRLQLWVAAVAAGS